MTGIGDENAPACSKTRGGSPETKIVRYIAPYDAVAHKDSLNQAKAFIEAAEAAHQKVLVAFYTPGTHRLRCRAWPAISISSRNS